LEFALIRGAICDIEVREKAGSNGKTREEGRQKRETEESYPQF